MSVKRIGVLTSGGDAPGMNACVRAVVRSALNKGLKVKGISRGFSGLMNSEVFDMDAKSAGNIINKSSLLAAPLLEKTILANKLA